MTNESGDDLKAAIEELEDAIDCAGAVREDDEIVTANAGSIRIALDTIERLQAENEELKASGHDVFRIAVQHQTRANEAEATVERLQADLERAVEVMKPFAEAAESLDDDHGENGHIWESPAAMCIDAGHLRQARSFIASRRGG